MSAIHTVRSSFSKETEARRFGIDCAAVVLPSLSTSAVAAYTATEAVDAGHDAEFVRWARHSAIIAHLSRKVIA